MHCFGFLISLFGLVAINVLSYIATMQDCADKSPDCSSTATPLNVYMVIIGISLSKMSISFVIVMSIMLGNVIKKPLIQQNL